MIGAMAVFVILVLVICLKGASDAFDAAERRCSALEAELQVLRPRVVANESRLADVTIALAQSETQAQLFINAAHFQRDVVRDLGRLDGARAIEAPKGRGRA